MIVRRLENLDLLRHPGHLVSSAYPGQGGRTFHSLLPRFDDYVYILRPSP